MTKIAGGLLGLGDVAMLFESGGISAPIRVECAGLIDALVGVRPEVVALRLDQIRRQVFAAQGVEKQVKERGDELALRQIAAGAVNDENRRRAFGPGRRGDVV